MARFIYLIVSLLLISKSVNGLVDEQDGASKSTLNCSSVSQERIKEIQSYKPVVNEIIKAVMSGQFKGQTFSDLEYFVDNFGSRLTGSEALEKSIDFMLAKMDAIGLDNVHAENVTAPKWVR